MTQMGRQWWQKTTTSTTTGTTAVGTIYGGGRTTRSCSSTSSESNAAMSSCCGLSRLMRKLKRHSNKMLKTAASTSRQSSFQCRYDPLSYALNFDTSGTGSLLDEDYYKFCAFSSRFVATPKADHHCQIKV
uniref:Uncharacterized protein n=1 Tax=Nicotiana tabacum TaxID=4097 RepID=A0A1S3YLU0_TOBAC|nr:PREDICTED: uncharacterized protein LOC107777460 [Nicotiana tabacum]